MVYGDQGGAMNLYESWNFLVVASVFSSTSHISHLSAVNGSVMTAAYFTTGKSGMYSNIYVYYERVLSINIDGFF